MSFMCSLLSLLFLWLYRTQLIDAQTTDSICITGDDLTYLDGTYVWLSSDNTTQNSSIYYCQQCGQTQSDYGSSIDQTGAYLYVYRYSSSRYVYLRIAPDLDPDDSVYTETPWNWCFLGYSDYDTFNLEDCTAWYTLNVSYYGTKWYRDTNMNAYKCPSITSTPTSSPTIEQDIIITNHEYTEEWWVAFYLSNVNLSCGGTMSNVEITDNNNYKNEWIQYNSSIYLKHYQYVFGHKGYQFTLPISVRITRIYNDSNYTIYGYDVITSFVGAAQFDFGSNFCETETVEISESVSHESMWIISTFNWVQGSIYFIFIMIGLIALIDAKYCRKNDFFDITALFTAMMQILDMHSDIFNAVDVYDKYKLETDNNSIYLMIFLLEILFIIIPVIITLYQLYAASSKYWLNDNKIREWLFEYSKLLYLMSIFTGSSFSAVHIFNSNLFGFDLFNMGLNRKHMMSFNTKEVYSIILFEDIPQLLLSIWYGMILGTFTQITLFQMAYSCFSIVVTIMSMIIQKKIYITQDFVNITIDITGECIINNKIICRNRISDIKSYLAESVFGVNQRSIDIEKPINIPYGVRLKIHVMYNVNDKLNIAPENHYRRLLNISVSGSSFGEKLRSSWELTSTPRIGNIQCLFVKSKMKKQISINRKSQKNIGSLELVSNQQYQPPNMLYV